MRALEFDMSKVAQLVSASDILDEVMARRELNRYQLFIEEMRADGITDSGHLAKTLKLMADLHYLHQNLLLVKKDKKYAALVDEALPNINAFIQKSGQKRMTEVEACFNALYGLLVLRLKKEPISPETSEAMDSFSKMLAYLAAKYSQNQTK